MRRRALSLVELLVVLGVIGVLIGLMVPAIQRLRSSASKISCLNNLHNQALALLAYESTQGRFPPGAIAGPFEPHGVPAGVLHGLYPCVLGYLDSPARAAEYQWSVSYFDEANQNIVRSRLDVLLCPAAATFPVAVFAADPEGTPIRWGGGCHFGGLSPSSIFADLGWSEPDINFAGILQTNSMVRRGDIRDGASTTILLTEHGDRGAAWAGNGTLAGAREVFRGGPPGAAPHPSGLNVAFADGSTHHLAWSVRPTVFAALCTRAGGETISVDDY